MFVGRKGILVLARGLLARGLSPYRSISGVSRFFSDRNRLRADKIGAKSTLSSVTSVSETVGAFHHGRHGSCIRRHRRRLTKGNRNDNSIVILPLRHASDLSTFSTRRNNLQIVDNAFALSKKFKSLAWVIGKRREMVIRDLWNPLVRLW